MKLGVFSAHEWLYPDSEIKTNRISVSAAKNSYAAVQILVCDCVGKLQINTTFDGNELETDIFQLLKVKVGKNSTRQEPLDCEERTVEELEKYFTRKAPFIVYDPMKPFENETVFSGKAALFVRFKIPESLKAGQYNIKIEVNNNNNKEIAFVSLRVFDVAVPKKQSFKLINWTFPSSYDYAFQPFDEKHWDTLEKMARLGIYSGQNYICVTADFFDCEIIKGKYIFDFKNAEKYIKMHLDMGYEFIEIMHLREIYRFFKNRFDLSELYTRDSFEFIAEFLKQLYSFLEIKGWREITVQHIFDEPREAFLEEYIKLCKFVKEQIPDIPLIDAVLTPKVCEYIDIPIPPTRHYQLYKKEYDEACKNAKEFWLYTCCWPTAPYFNRFLDMPLVSIRFIHWLNFKTDSIGYLHWGFCCNSENFYHKIPEDADSDYFFKTYFDGDELPAGDTNIIYPYKNEPIGSVRLEMVRAGVEDYELLKMLEKKNPQKALKFADKVVNDKWYSDLNFNQFETIYAEFLSQFEK
ncbi:MAG: DUF4091 domain-containing protein [Ruminococcaceae bacterium]|nr:DUF4091 domain-containing protein [Oscillospiraceae bacterium]